MMDIQGAMFDMDGTLMDSLSGWIDIWKGISDRFLDGKPFLPEPEVDKKIRTMLLSDAILYIHEVCGIGQSGKELLDYTNEILRDFYKHRVPLKPGVMAYMEYLKEKGVKMCIASATDLPLVHLAVESCGIGTFLSDIISCTEVGKGKEEPDVFFAAQKRLGTPLEQTWVFEDSYTALKTAQHAGFHTVGVYDALSYHQKEIAETADVYIAKNETMEKLIRE